MNEEYDLELLWEMLLSRDAERIRTAWAVLTPDERSEVRAHLGRMAAEEGWLAAQRASARAALDCVDASPDIPASDE